MSRFQTYNQNGYYWAIFIAKLYRIETLLTKNMDMQQYKNKYKPCIYLGSFIFGYRDISMLFIVT